MNEKRIGPTVVTTESCSNCSVYQTMSDPEQGDSVTHRYCAHAALQSPRPIATDTRTPDWCPVKAAAEPQQPIHTLTDARCDELVIKLNDLLNQGSDRYIVWIPMDSDSAPKLRAAIRSVLCPR